MPPNWHQQRGYFDSRQRISSDWWIECIYHSNAHRPQPQRKHEIIDDFETIKEKIADRSLEKSFWSNLPRYRKDQVPSAQEYELKYGRTVHSRSLHALFSQRFTCIESSTCHVECSDDEQVVRSTSWKTDRQGGDQLKRTCAYRKMHGQYQNERCNDTSV